MHAALALAAYTSKQLPVLPVCVHMAPMAPAAAGLRGLPRNGFASEHTADELATKESPVKNIVQKTDASGVGGDEQVGVEATSVMLNISRIISTVSAHSACIV